MAECLSSNIPRTVKVNKQQAFNVCALTTGDPELESRVIVTLGNPSQKEDFDLVIFIGGAFLPVEFNEYGVFIFEEPMLNSCALLFITFKEKGEYLFELDLVQDEGNLPLANLTLEVTAVKGE
ncbi:hypothetical protein JF544_01460 [Halobacillus kuroshimensis]|uniref:DUF4469 domain-containing protein n=1 Tax=Halobacillus kuroshimensis TaxID=302481 RepID=A0ABS3DRM4_9BACI|nr:MULTISPECIES: hypothetical protein [Halobacillus]MBN8233888.1 hypothetical protein [Halobacillus kuroshimensis]